MGTKCRSDVNDELDPGDYRKGSHGFPIEAIKALKSPHH